MKMNRTLSGLSTALLLSGPGAAFAEPAPAPQEAQTASAPAAAEPAPAETVKPEERLDLLEEKQKDAVVTGDLPGSIRIPGTELSLRPYGYAELNWVHDFKADNSDIDYATFAPYLPLNGTPEANRKNRDYLTGRTSRIGIEAGLPTRFGMLGAKIEGDFNNEPRTGDTAQYGSPRNVITQQQTSSYGFRLRHAYGQFGGLLIGQTWSTFMDVDNFPETVDFNGPVGGTIVRQPLIRFSYATLAAGTFTAAIENSSSYVLDDEGAVMASSLSRMPDLVLRWDKGFEGGAMSVRAITQELRINDGEVEATRRGWGAAASALVKIRGSDLLTLAVTGGDGIGRYLNYIEGAFYDADVDRIEVERAAGFVVGYQLKPTDWVRINFAYGMTRNFDNAYTEAIEANGLDTGRFGINRWVQQAHVGPIFTPIKNVDLGIEAIWAKRKTLAGDTGDMARLNFMARYYIN
jgi:hypothetical protein